MWTDGRWLRRAKHFSVATLLLADVPEAAAEGDQRFRGDERGTGDDLQLIPQQSRARPLGKLRLPVAETSQQLGGRPRTSLRVHLCMDQTWKSTLLLDLRILLPAGYVTALLFVLS